MYKEAITERLRPKDMKIHENLKLLVVETIEIPASSFDCISDNIFRYPFLIIFFRYRGVIFYQRCE